MAYEFDAADVSFLRSADGTAALAALARRPLKGDLADVSAARELVGARFAAAVLETVQLRRAAESKLESPADWLSTGTALQQATATPVARHRAARLVGRRVHDVTCSIGADLVELAQVAERCVGSDLDEVRLAMAQHNLDVRRASAGLVRADALRPVTRGTTVLADPGRRDGSGRRRWNPADLVPPLDELLETYAGRDLVVKCAPGLDFDQVPPGEVEVVSWAGQVREATLWLGGLAEPGVHRRATVLGAGWSAEDAWTITDRDPDDCETRPVGQWIIDPDGAVVRAGLVRHYGCRFGLGQLDPRIAYLTGDQPPPGVRAFRVLEESRYTEKALRALLRKHDVGQLEILIRGLNVDPDALRRTLKPKGRTAATIVLTRIGDRATAYFCQPERT